MRSIILLFLLCTATAASATNSTLKAAIEREQARPTGHNSTLNTQHSSLASAATGDKGVFPLLAWYSIAPQDATRERYLELRDAGFNLSTSDYKTEDDVRQALQVSRGTGIRLIVSSPEMWTDVPAYVARYRRHPQLAGWFLRDEPTPADFPQLDSLARQIRTADPHHLIYLDLYPTYVPLGALGTRDYREYVHRSIHEVPTGLLSFDHYPILTGGVRPDYFDNLQIIADEARQAHIPFWAFILSNPHGDYPTPTRQALRYQAFCNLAYGAQGLQYFTYWHAVILQGRRTHTYDLIRELNAEIQALAPIFLGAQVLDVRHTGDSIPTGTQRLTTLPQGLHSLSSQGGDGLLVSTLTNHHQRYIMLVNRDYHHRQAVTLTADSATQRILPDGTTVPLNRYHSTLWLDPADYLLLRVPCE